MWNFSLGGGEEYSQNPEEFSEIYGMEYQELLDESSLYPIAIKKEMNNLEEL